MVPWTALARNHWFSRSLLLLGLLLWQGKVTVAYPSVTYPRQTAIAREDDSSLKSSLPFPRSLETGRLSASEIARQITVRVLGNPRVGSGVIVQRQGLMYTVLTNKHVLNYTYDHRYQVLTADAQQHQARWLQSRHFGDVDLAVLQFQSRRSYHVARAGDANTLSLGSSVYAAGFPTWHWLNGQIPQSTRAWGLKALKITQGNLVMRLQGKSLEAGYTLGYTNAVEDGMSGGPVLNQQGHLIGVNGRLAYPWLGIEDFLFADQTQPSKAQFHKMEPLNWAIPITTFLHMNQ